jgi:hypothetical protein
LVGKVAVSFSGTNALVGDASIDLPHDCTLYAYLECNSFSTTFMNVMTCGTSSGANNVRTLFMERSRTSDTPASTARGSSVIQNTFTSAPAGAALVLNTWTVVAVVRSAGTVTVYKDGANALATTISVPANFDALLTSASNHTPGPLVIGAQFVNSTPTAQFPWNGGIKEIRIYNNAHSAAQVAAVSTAMTT